MISILLEATQCYAEPENKKGLLHQAKFLFRAIRQWPYTHHWFRFLTEQSELAAVLPQQPQWLHKLQRPYMCQGLSTQAKLQLLRQHYDQFFTLIPDLLRARLLAERAVLLATIEGKSGARYRVALSLTHTMDKEGELMLTLTQENSDDRLVTLAFSLGADIRGNSQILLGCLQGANGAGAKERFRDVTKDLHGLMPKTLMVKVLFMLARQMEISRVLAVSNTGHVHNSKTHHYHRINADYDALWVSLGGTPADACFYQLDPQQAERPRADIPSNKRAQYQRRHHLEAELRKQLAVVWEDDCLAS